ncbi:40S ribosomal protein S2 [Sciurus carolinensis]|uniref:40S ribosomal protein S2 n=1 Tax=Sciurus carolinensis TaxID=30640 RepID=A0AA41T3J8_SCICA|nr:40S ribosomal protein S2 [Sciurus carolinensis]
MPVQREVSEVPEVPGDLEWVAKVASAGASAAVSQAVAGAWSWLGQGRGVHGGKVEDKEWILVPKLGHLVKDTKINFMEKIYLFSLPIKEPEVIDFFLGASLKDEVLKIKTVQKQTPAGQRTRFKAFVAMGDYSGQLDWEYSAPRR